MSEKTEDDSAIDSRGQERRDGWEGEHGAQTREPLVPPVVVGAISLYPKSRAWAVCDEVKIVAGGRDLQAREACEKGLTWQRLGQRYTIRREATHAVHRYCDVCQNIEDVDGANILWAGL